MQQWRRSEEDYLFERRPPRPEPPPQPQRMRSTSPFGGGGGGDEEFENPIMAQAKAMLSKVMACRTPDDPMNAEIVRGKKHMICSSRVISVSFVNLFTDVGDARLAQFVSKTLEKAVAAYKIRQSERRPLGAVVDVGPIAPPSRSKTQSGDMFSLRESQGSREGGGARSGGLIGLSKPLFESFAEDSGGHASWDTSGASNTLFPLPSHSGGSSGFVRLPMRRESPVEFSHGTHFMEPPNKRKSNLEQMWRKYDVAGGEGAGRYN